MPTSSGFLFISPSNVPKQEDNSALDNAFFFSFAEVYLYDLFTSKCTCETKLVFSHFAVGGLTLNGCRACAKEVSHRAGSSGT